MKKSIKKKPQAYLPAYYRLGIFIGLLLCSISGGDILGDASKDYKLKAAYLVRFANYISWPQLNTETITIGVLGKHGFEGLLGRINRMKAQGKNLRMKEIYSIGDAITCCQILFISRSEQNQIQKIIAGLQNKNTPVLTVSELGHFINLGGMIDFVRKGSKLKFKIHLDRITGAGLTANSKLSKSGIVVK